MQPISDIYSYPLIIHHCFSIDSCTATRPWIVIYGSAVRCGIETRDQEVSYSTVARPKCVRVTIRGAAKTRMSQRQSQTKEPTTTGCLTGVVVPRKRGCLCCEQDIIYTGLVKTLYRTQRRKVRRRLRRSLQKLPWGSVLNPGGRLSELSKSIISRDSS